MIEDVVIKAFVGNSVHLNMVNGTLEHYFSDLDVCLRGTLSPVAHLQLSKPESPPPDLSMLSRESSKWVSVFDVTYLGSADQFRRNDPEGLRSYGG